MERLDRRVRPVWAALAFAQALLLGSMVGAVASVVDPDVAWIGVVVGVVAALAGVVVAHLRYRRWHFEVTDDTLYLERGVFTRVKTVVPYVRVQHVDSRRQPLDRAVGLASVVVYTAGSRSEDVAIPGLARDRAEELREELRRLAIERDTVDAV